MLTKDVWTEAISAPTTNMTEHEPADTPVHHPDLEWARDTVRKAKGDRVTEKELDTLMYDGLLGCYLMTWKGMCLGIEKDGHMHT